MDQKGYKMDQLNIGKRAEIRVLGPKIPVIWQIYFSGIGGYPHSPLTDFFLQKAIFGSTRSTLTENPLSSISRPNI